MNSTFALRTRHLAPHRDLAVTVSGSFHRHMHEIGKAVEELASLSIRVLSPADPRIVAAQGEFLFVASDPVRSVRLVQDRHLESIRASSFLWLECSDGYVGQSASMELGFAAAIGIPIYSTHKPSDLTLRQYVKIVPSLAEAVRLAQASPRVRQSEGILINPRASIAEAHDTLERLGTVLTRPGNSGEPAQRAYEYVADVRKTLAMPTHMQ
ncbi:MAG: hypothetical protein WCG81_19110 [Candidatus Angelobacter sp.]